MKYSTKREWNVNGLENDLKYNYKVKLASNCNETCMVSFYIERKDYIKKLYGAKMYFVNG